MRVRALLIGAATIAALGFACPSVPAHAGTPTPDPYTTSTGSPAPSYHPPTGTASPQPTRGQPGYGTPTQPPATSPAPPPQSASPTPVPSRTAPSPRPSRSTVPPAPPAEELPKTGVDAGVIGLVGFLMLVVGLVAIIVARLRRTPGGPGRHTSRGEPHQG